MPNRIKLSFALAIIFIVAALFLGTAAPHQPNVAAKSPYVSALADYSVGTAAAGSCNSGCEVLQGIQSCRGGEFPGTRCTIVSGSCSVKTCGPH